MSNQLEINDSAKEVAAPATQLFNECWTDKNLNTKPLGGNNDSVLDFGKSDIYQAVSGQVMTALKNIEEDLKSPSNFARDHGFIPNDRGLVTSHRDRGTLLPGAPDGSLLPGAPDGSLKPGAPDGSLLPGAPDGSLLPGAPDGKLLPGAPDGSLLPGAPDGSLLPGAPNGTLLPGAHDGTLR